MGTRFTACIATLAVLLSGGCATQIMQSYVGKPLSVPMLDYGPPSNAFDIDTNTRAFIWTMKHSYSTPGYASTMGTVNSTGFFNSSTYFSPPRTYDWSCNYVLLARRNDSGVGGPSGWTVVDFRKPNLMCE